MGRGYPPRSPRNRIAFDFRCAANHPPPDLLASTPPDEGFQRKFRLRGFPTGLWPDGQPKSALAWTLFPMRMRIQGVRLGPGHTGGGPPPFGPRPTS